MTGRRCPARLLLTQAMGRLLKVRSRGPLSGPRKHLSSQGLGLCCRLTTKVWPSSVHPLPQVPVVSPGQEGKKGQEQVTSLHRGADWWPFIRRRASFQQSLFVSPKSPGDSVPRENDSLDPRPCPALGDTQPRHFPGRSKRAAAMRLQVDVGSTE